MAVWLGQIPLSLLSLVKRSAFLLCANVIILVCNFATVFKFGAKCNGFSIQEFVLQDPVSEFKVVSFMIMNGGQAIKAAKYQKDIDNAKRRNWDKHWKPLKQEPPMQANTRLIDIYLHIRVKGQKSN